MNKNDENKTAGDVRSSDWLADSAVLGRIAMLVSPLAPDGVCETEEIVRHLVKVAYGSKWALKELERVRLERLSAAGLGREATAISEARCSLIVTIRGETANEKLNDGAKPGKVGHE